MRATMKKSLIPAVSAILFSLNTFSQVKWTTISADNRQNIGLKADGTIWTWGENTYGQLGDGSLTDRLYPVKIGSDNNWSAVSAGYFHSIALKSNGTLWGWGRNGTGQVGDGSTTQRTSPVQVGSDTKWKSIVAGGQHSLGIKTDSTLWSWGRNNGGQIGDGSTSQRNSPIQIGTEKKWVNIAAGYVHTLGLKADSTLWAWGFNGSGQIGDGNNTDQLTPKQIGSSKWRSIAAGYYFSLAIKSDGTLWAWGENGSGQLGDGSTTQRTSPVQIGTDKTWTNIAAGSDHSLAMKSDGSLWMWGSNTNGQFGDGSTTNRTSPIKIGSSVWASIAAGSSHSICLKPDLYQYCAAGNNSVGQIGDSTTANKTTFLCISSCKAPASPTSYNKRICKGAKATLTAIGIGKLGWYTAAIGGTFLGAGNEFITPVLTASKTYYVQDSTCSSSAIRTAVFVTVDTLPIVTAFASDTLVCAETLVTFNGGGAKSYTWTNGVINGVGFAVTTTAIYKVTGTDGNNCSDTAIIKVNVIPLPDLTTTLTGMVIKSNQNGASYIWLNCNNGYKPISGQTNQTYVATDKGNYAVLVTLNDCSDTSACVKVDNVGIGKTGSDHRELVVYPNPGYGSVIVKSSVGGLYSLVNEWGQTIQSFELNQDSHQTVIIENLNNGVYFLVGFNNDLLTRQKLVVMK
jgi:alpha-tubulin suppressor-like RCC1 family protein